MRVRSAFAGVAMAMMASAVLASAALGGAGLAGQNVTIQDSFASIDTFQALNSTDERSRDNSGDDFIGFSENLHPPVLRGPEGKADTFVSLGTTLATPSSRPFPTGPLNDIAVTGRLRDEATKSSNPAPGVPVASSEGSAEVEFTTNGPTPFLFSGALNAQNSDSNDCTEIDVELSGPLNRTFLARGGGDCSPSGPRNRGFLVADVLPAGDYQLNVDYDATVDPEYRGTETATGAVEANIFFFRRCTVLGDNRPSNLNGTTGNDVICGRGGNDRINGRGGADLVFGGNGGDTINGGGGGDDLRGDSGADTVRGQGGKDRLDGGPGRDTLSGGAADDKIKAHDGAADDVNGGGGNRDIATVDRRRDTVRGVEVVRH
jgi:RTX calcium-binding nonapeptide repeat (4 copies)